MSSFDKSIVNGDLCRIRLKVSGDGLWDHSYGYGASLLIRTGWNDGCEMRESNVSVDELRDLRHLIDRVLELADREKR